MECKKSSNLRKLCLYRIINSTRIILGLLRQTIRFPFIAPGAKLGLANIVTLLKKKALSFKVVLVQR